MIESASHPKDLHAWDPATYPFYIELFGETSPLLDTGFSEVLKPGASEAEAVAAAPIYEYWWTIGHPGWHGERHPHALWDEEPAGLVFLFFPTDSGWRIKELAATVKYLSPVENRKSLFTALATDWKTVSPLIGDVGQLAAVAAPALGAAAKTVTSTVDALAKLQINAVPPTENNLDWSVQKVTSLRDWQRGAMQGVMWKLPKTMFTELGFRLTGSLALSFIPCSTQAVDGPANAPGTPRPGSVLVNALLRGKDDTWQPGESDFVQLTVLPQLPKATA